MDEIERLELQIEDLRDAIERSRRFALAGQASVVAGPALLVAILIGLVAFTPARTVFALALAIGGMVLSGSSRSTTGELRRALNGSRRRGTPQSTASSSSTRARERTNPVVHSDRGRLRSSEESRPSDRVKSMSVTVRPLCAVSGWRWGQERKHAQDHRLDRDWRHPSACAPFGGRPDGLRRQTRRSVDVDFRPRWNRNNESKDRARAGAEYMREHRRAAHPYHHAPSHPSQ